MSSSPTATTGTQSFIENAIWQAEVCNACRYCEGFCAVFPALERRQSFALADLQYLANLCFDCRACFYACMYAPPHEFGVNFPKMLSQVRRESYEQYAMPAFAQRLFKHQWWFAIATTVLSCVFLFALIAMSGDAGRIFGVHIGEGSFYRVLPYTLMFIPAGVISVVALALLLGGGVRFLRRTHGRVGDLLDLSALGRATADVLQLRYLRGGGAGGCTYPTERASHARAVYHHLVFYGFLAAFASTTSAFFQQDVLGWLPPYPLLSVPVVLGTIGGVAMIVGCFGLMALKRRADREPADAGAIAIEYVFLMLLAVVNISGLLLLALRETTLMGTLLVLHIGTVFSLYFAIPYSKFAHFIYRYAALVQNRIEGRHIAQGHGG
jgi:citrate/tricarballylate utilization protein